MVKIGKNYKVPEWFPVDKFDSSNRSWAYTGENFISPSASKICPLRKSTTTCKGTDHGLTSEMNV